MQNQKSERSMSRYGIKLPCLILVALMMAGCQSSMVPYERPMLLPSLAEPCPPLRELQTNDWDDIAQSYISVVLQYGACRAKHEAIVEAWNQGAAAPPSQAGGK